MALNVGTIAVALELDDSNFKLGLDAAKSSLNDYLNDLAKSSGQLSELKAEIPIAVDIPMVAEDFAAQVQSLAKSGGTNVEVPIAVEISNGAENFAAQAQAAVESSGANIEVPLDFFDVQASDLGAEISAQFGAAGTEAGTAFGANVTAGILAGSAGIAAAVSGIGSAVTAALAPASAGASAEGMLLASSFASGVASGAGAAQANAAGMASGALNAARGSASGAQSIGRMISAGVASGIRSGQSGVVSAAIAMVKAAVAAAKAAAQIHSPSKITTKFGRFWDEGWAVGIRKNTPLVAGEAADMVNDTIKAVDGFGGILTPDIEGALRSALYVEPPAGVAYGAARQTTPEVRVTGPAIDYDALADAMNQRQVSLYMNDRRMAQVMAAETARALSARSRSIAMGYGKR